MLIPNGYAQANLRFTGSNLPNGAEITLGLDLDLSSATNPTEVAQDVRDAWAASTIPDHYGVNQTLSSILVKYGPNSTGPSADIGVSVPGVATGEVVPPNVAALIRKNTGFGGRTGRGRLYLPGVPDAQVQEDGDLTPTWQAGLTIAFEDFRTELASRGLVATLLHDAGSPVTTPMPITNFTADSRVATQRDRLR